MRAFIQHHRLVSFIGLAYALSWAGWLPLLVQGARVVPGGGVTHFPGLMGPAAAAFIIVAVTEGRPGLGRLFRRLVLVSKPPLRFLGYSLSPLAFLGLALVAAKLGHNPIPPLREFALYSGLPPLPLVSVLLLVFLFNGYGEETGWRGFALGLLQERFGLVKGTLALGIVWAGWHIPAFWFVEGYRSMSLATLIGGFGLGICAGSVVLARVTNRTEGSVFAAALWHATYNLTSATAASRGLIGAVTSTCVMVWAGVLLLQEWRHPLARSRIAVSAAT
jgi:membrane protease YdiL (CAAX protease family)